PRLLASNVTKKRISREQRATTTSASPAPTNLDPGTLLSVRWRKCSRRQHHPPAVTAAAEVLRSLPHENKDMGGVRDVEEGDDRKKEDAMEVEISRGEIDAVKRGKDGSTKGSE
ncbi:unnamed protein product, partial [Ascophyllum nodosum]